MRITDDPTRLEVYSAAMSQDRSPEEMPRQWKVESFDMTKGFGTLVHESGHRILFQHEAWNLGGWKPAKKLAAYRGADSPIWPQPGELVDVEWKKSFAGKTVPRVVRPTGRDLSQPKEHKLSAWIKAIQKCSGHFSGVTTARLLKRVAALDEDQAEEWKDGEARDAEAYAWLLFALGAEEHSSDEALKWIYSDDHRWDRIWEPPKGCGRRFVDGNGAAPRSALTRSNSATTGVL
jgi:hypothetical protein